MATLTEAQRLSNAVLAFSLHGKSIQDIADLSPVSETDLSPTIEALRKAKTELETKIHTINEETKDDVSSWVKNAKILQEDIIRSKAIANDIVRQSEAPDVSGEAIQHAETRVEFLQREVQYSQQLRGALASIQYVSQLLGEVEQASKERRILDSLRLLEKSWAALDEVGVSKGTRIVKLLDSRAFELKSEVHEVFNHVWKALVQVDMETGRATIYEAHKDEKMNLTDTVIGLKAYKEVDERMEQLWRNLDAAIVSPRMDTKKATVPAIKVESDVIELTGSTERTVEALLSDLESVLLFVAGRLPKDLLQPLCSFMMADLIPKLIQEWLNLAIPSGLKDMHSFHALISRTKAFCEALHEAGYTGFGELRQWADKAPMKWLEKCRETSLDTIRAKLANGMGELKRVEKIEKQMVSLAEGKELATTGAGAAADSNDWGGADWGDAWEDDQNQENKESAPEVKANGDEKRTGDDDDGTDAWGWDDDETAEGTEEEKEPTESTDDDDGADAWGWGDDGAEPEPAEPKQPKAPAATKAVTKPQKVETRELVFKETYSISSMPEPVLELIVSILEDGAVLTKDGNDEHSLVAATAPGLFGLPTFVLALFRAISPHYYSLDVGGNMFLYNDTTYLAEKLSDFSSTWKQREDLTPRARNMLRLDNDIKSLESFANRSYSNEMNIQKTVLQDLIGSSQNMMHQDEKEDAIESGTARIRTMAATWEPILKRSVWSQAIGSLADSLASRIISDVLELSSIGQEEAYSIAKLIASVTELDDLFLPSKLSGADATKDEVPTTSQYAPNWLRLKYLSEVLQSNLNEVRFLWCDSELSLYFTVDEVIELINASFEDNARTRETIREIKARPARP
ncbi:Centromere/kinetochorezw10-like-like protein [Cladobotryum mycophilum]|uniref:Centromere/kinetochorezw10-like-like protein n=1 Tax=Cladobotryum mycophilum TaxID=491253 RepID=A0ABR0SPX5_9HYPO